MLLILGAIALIVASIFCAIGVMRIRAQRKQPIDTPCGFPNVYDCTSCSDRDYCCEQ